MQNIKHRTTLSSTPLSDCYQANMLSAAQSTHSPTCLDNYFIPFFLFKILMSLSPIFNFTWTSSFLFKITLRTIRREFLQIANTMFITSIIFPYSAFPPGWYSHVLTQSQCLHLYRWDYPLPTQWHHSSNSLLCLLEHQICTLLNDSLQHSSAISSIWNNNKVYWSPFPICHDFFAPFTKKFLEGCLYFVFNSIPPPILSSHALINQVFTYSIKVTSDLHFAKSKN